MNNSILSALRRHRQGIHRALGSPHRPLCSTAAAFAVATILAAAPPASATIYTWDNTGTDTVAPTGGAGPWNTANHFTTDGGATYIGWTNLVGDEVLFKGTGGAVSVDQPITNFLGLKFDVNNYVLSGSSLTSGAPTATINVITGATATINNVISGTNLTIGSSGYSGTLILGGNSNYTGSTTFNNAATVRLGISNALPVTTTLNQGSGGSIFDLNGFDQAVVQIGAGSQSTLTNTNLTTRSTLTINNGVATVTASSQILRGNLNVTKTGTGSWAPNSDNDFTGLLTLAGGTNTFTTNTQMGAVGVSTTVLDGSGTNAPLMTLSSEASRAATTFNRAILLVGSGGRLATTGVKSATISGVISGTGDLRYGGQTQGAMILGGNNTYSGLTKLENAGTVLIAANDNAFGLSPMISQTATSTVGFQRSLTNQNINIGAATDITLTQVPHGAGLGSIHNFGGDNSFGGQIIMSANSLLYAAESGTSLLLKGVISGARAFTKGYGGAITLSGANTFTGATTINLGTLKLDFSQTGAPTDHIINTATNTSALTLAGGNLDIIGKSGATANNQRFNGMTVGAGSSSLNVDESTNTAGVNVTLGTLATRVIGGTVNFTLPTIGTIGSATGTASTILTSNSSGAAYATVGGNDWAAKDATNAFIVGGSTIGGFYTANDGTVLPGTLSGNANMSADTTTTLTASPSITSLRFNNSGARTIDINGQTLTTGGILITSGVGANASTITGGTLTGTAAKDLVIIQNNVGAGRALTIGSTIADNAASGLTKAGAGTLELTGTNTYTGPTTITGGVLKLTAAALGLPGGIAAAGGTSNLTFKGGVLGLTSDFNRTLGFGVTQVQFTGDGGFAAYGAPRTVNLGAVMRWTNTSGFGAIPIGSALLLSADDATDTLIFASDLALTGSTGGTDAAAPQLREIRVPNGSAAVDARISGSISKNSGILKTGAGTLEMSGANTYTGMTQIDAGTLILSGTFSTGSSEVTAFTVNNGSTLQIANSSALGNAFFVTAGTVSFNNASSYLARGLTLGGGAAGTTAVVSTNTGTMTVGPDGVFYNGNFNNDNGASITSTSGTLSLGTTVKTFAINNSTIATDDLTVSALVSGVLGGITKLGTGKMVLSNTANTYTGATSVSDGILSINSIANIGAGNVSAIGAPTTAANGTISLGALTTTGQLTYTGGASTTDRVIKLAGATGGAIIDQSGTGLLKFISNVLAPGAAATDQRKTLTLQGSGTGEISGNIVNSTLGTAGQVATSLTKTGSGTWTLSGVNSFTGPTTVNAGTLLVSSSIASNSVSVSISGTLGGGTTATPGVTGAVTVNLGGTLSPGTSIGTLNTGALALNNGSTFALEIGANTSDLVNVNGAATLTGDIALKIALTAQPGLMAYTIIDGSAALSGYSGGARFVYGGNSLDDNEPFTVVDNGFTQAFTISYGGSDGNDVILNAAVIPEPGTASTLLLGLGSLIGLQRFRRRRF